MPTITKKIKTIQGNNLIGEGNIDILPSNPIFDETKKYTIELVANDEKTAYELHWVETEEIEDVDNKEYTRE